MTLTQERLRYLLHYDPETGVFTWNKREGKTRGERSFNSKHAGRIAGRINVDGYIMLHVDRRYLSAHRLAWLYMTGSFPPAQIDHINNIRDDNRFSNLRAATISQQMHNRPGWGALGIKGVHRARGEKRPYKVQFGVGGTTACFGHFATLEEAAEVARRVHDELAGAFAKHVSRPSGRELL